MGMVGTWPGRGGAKGLLKRQVVGLKGYYEIFIYCILA